MITKLADALAPEGVAYVVQLSILSQRRTAELLATPAWMARVVDYGVFPFRPSSTTSAPQIGRVEQLSDAGHVRAGDHDLLVAYLLEIRPRAAHAAGAGARGAVSTPTTPSGWRPTNASAPRSSRCRTSGPASEIVDRCPAAAALAADLDRVS